MTPSLFGDEPRKKPDRIARPLDPYFEAVAALIGRASALAATGRVFIVCKAMRDRGIPAERVKELPALIARYAPWRKVVDVAAVQQCWPWLIEPPTEVRTAGPLDFAESARRDCDGKRPF